jgi:dihydroflavonol-4-reductase
VQVVVVTGATGHLGTVLVRNLVEAGREVRYLTRGAGNAPGLAGIGAEQVTGELSDTELLERIFWGASVVFHGAAKVSFGHGDKAELYRVNVDGTRSVLKAARHARVGRIVHVGSIEAFPLAESPFPITEENELRPDHTVTEYGRTKALGMSAVLAAAREGMDTVVCCPTAFLGPPDYRVSAMGRLVLDYLHRRLPAYVDGGFDFVDVRDVAEGLVRAARRGRAGRVYLLSGRYVDVPELMAMLESLTGVRRPRIRFASSTLLPIMPIVETYYRVSGRPPRFTSDSLRLLGLGVRVDSSRARTELGYAPRRIEVTLADAVAWFRAHGCIR